MNSTTSAATGGGFAFLGESPGAWVIFIVLLTVFLWLWGSTLRYLGGEV